MTTQAPVISCFVDWVHLLNSEQKITYVLEPPSFWFTQLWLPPSASNQE